MLEFENADILFLITCLKNVKMCFSPADVVDLELTCELIKTNLDFMHLTSTEFNRSVFI